MARGSALDRQRSRAGHASVADQQKRATIYRNLFIQKRLPLSKIARFRAKQLHH